MTGTRPPPAVERMFSDILRGFERDRQRTELEAILEDPHAHRLTKIMGPKGNRYRYVGGDPDHVGCRIRFCWSSWKNAAGYYLAWKETHSDTAAERVGWTAHRTRKAAMKFAERWHRDWKADQARRARG